MDVDISAMIAEISATSYSDISLRPMNLPGHIIDLACSLEEQAVGDNDIIRWCMCFMDKPKEASLVTAFLGTSERTLRDISELVKTFI